MLSVGRKHRERNNARGEGGGCPGVVQFEKMPACLSHVRHVKAAVCYAGFGSAMQRLGRWVPQQNAPWRSGVCGGGLCCAAEVNVDVDGRRRSGGTLSSLFADSVGGLWP